MEFIGCVLLGICLLVFHFVYKYKIKRLESHGKRTEGVIVDYINEKGSSYPLVTYEISNSESITEIFRLTLNFSKYKIGQTVPVVYDPDNTKDFVISDNKSTLIINVFLGAGVFFVLLGAFLYFHSQN